MGKAVIGGVPFTSNGSNINMKYPKVFASSVNPKELALTWKGVVLGILTTASTVILPLAPILGWNITPDDFSNLFNGVGNFFDSVDSLITAVLGIVAAFQVVWGLIRKTLVEVGIIKTK